MSTAVKIVATSVDLAPKAKTLAVFDGNEYIYYPITLGIRNGNFVPVLKAPQVIKEGFVTFERKLFKFGLRDFFRGRLNVAQPAQSSRIVSRASVVTASAVPEPAPTSSDQPGTSGLFRDDLDQDTNLAWGEQIDSLLYATNSEEEWGGEAIT